MATNPFQEITNRVPRIIDHEQDQGDGELDAEGQQAPPAEG
jgi:hypothetical protein